MLFKHTDYEPAQFLFGLGALLVSHPFEVARVLIVNGEKSRPIGSTVATLQSLYAAEGIAGLYKGYIPRTIHQLPILMGLGYVVTRPSFDYLGVQQAQMD